VRSLEARRRVSFEGYDYTESFGYGVPSLLSFALLCSRLFFSTQTATDVRACSPPCPVSLLFLVFLRYSVFSVLVISFSVPGLLFFSFFFFFFLFFFFFNAPSLQADLFQKCCTPPVSSSPWSFFFLFFLAPSFTSIFSPS